MNALDTYTFEFPPAKDTARRLTPKKAIRFGLVTDLHYAEKDPSYGRYYRQSLKKLDEALACFQESGIDFIFELGDLKDQSERPTIPQTLAFLDDAESHLQRLGKDVYHVLGNHDMDSISKKDFLAHTRNPGEANGKGNYTFERNGLTFIVLDATFREDQSDYDRSNYDWRIAVVPDWELVWLEEQLQKGRGPVVVVVHQLLEGADEIPRTLFVHNADRVNQILVDSKRVLAVLQGHHHDGDITIRNDIPYITFPGLIEGPYPKTAFAIVEISPNGTIRIEGHGQPPRLSKPLPL